MTTPQIGWLLEGDPVIRWQTMRDLCGTPNAEWQAERARTTELGWGAQFIAALNSDNAWPDGRWTGAPWTLLTIMDCGLPPDHPRLHVASSRFLDHMLTPSPGARANWLLTDVDLCHVGFWLRIGAYFTPHDERLVELADTLLHMQMEDGGWNCRMRRVPSTTHSSFHTTFNVLEALACASDAGIIDRAVFRASEARALEFMLSHKMYRSDKTGEVVSERFTHLTYPSHWHYTVLRGLDYMRNCPEIKDPRLEDPLSMIESRCNHQGRWPVEKRIAGTSLFDMERFGGESRWTTLKTLRVLDKVNSKQD